MLPEYLDKLLNAANGQAPQSAYLGPPGGYPGVPTPEDDAEAILALEQGEMGHVAVLRPRLCQRKGVFFLAARQWFAPAKLQGIGMMKVAKDQLDERVAGSMADDLELVIRSCLGAADGALISAPSARHSAFIGVPHFASMVAELVAAKLGSQYGILFKVTPATARGHHPAREKDPPIVLGQNIPAHRRVILIDDLATSAKTLEWHVNALKALGVNCSAVVWVYGSTSGVGR